MPLTPLSRPFSRTSVPGRTSTGGYFRDSKGLVRPIPTGMTRNASGDFDEDELTAMQLDRGTAGLNPNNGLADAAASRSLARKRLAQLDGPVVGSMPQVRGRLKMHRNKFTR